MPAVILGWPTLSQLRNVDYSYFEQLAGYLDHISPEAQNALEALAEDVKRPAGSNGRAKPPTRPSPRPGRSW